MKGFQGIKPARLKISPFEQQSSYFPNPEKSVSLSPDYPRSPVCSKMSSRIPAEDKKEERELRVLLSVLRTRGIDVRREKLARGRSYRVKSGVCEVFGQDVVFVDKELPARQQISVLIDYLVERGLSFEPEALTALSDSNRELLAARGVIHQQVQSSS